MSKPKKRTPGQAKKATRSNQTLYWTVGGILLVAVIAFGAFTLLKGNSPSGVTPLAALPAEVDVAQAAALRESGAFVLDVRQPDEWNEYHIPGTTLIPLDQLESRLDEVPKDQEVVVVCRSGNRSQAGRDILRNAGYDQVTSMAGGLNGWIQAGFEWVSGP